MLKPPLDPVKLHPVKPRSSGAFFIIKSWAIEDDQQTLAFQFESSKYGPFRETIKFPSKLSEQKIHSREFDQLARLLSTALALSYYKLHAPPQLIINMPLCSGAEALVRAMYHDGLGEFYARNALPYPPQLSISFQEPAENDGAEHDSAENNDKVAVKTPSLSPPSHQALVAFGGGKDSHVSLEILQRLGHETLLISVVLSKKTKARMGEMYNGDLIYIDRRLDKKLFALNGTDGVMNGHVPITAMNSLILSLYAFCHDIKPVIFSNERGSSQFTRIYQGHPINHQYSKGQVFEKLLSKAISQASENKVDYFSLLRPFSEVWIGWAFANICTSSWHKVASCNKNFIFHAEGLAAGQRWCGACSKCLYTGIILAPFLSHDAFLDVFEIDLFEDLTNLAVIKALAGLGGEKPWECVGDIDDTRALLHILAYHDIWKDKACIKAIKEIIDPRQTLTESRTHIKRELSAHGENIVPPHIYNQILQLMETWQSAPVE